MLCDCFHVHKVFTLILCFTEKKYQNPLPTLGLPLSKLKRAKWVLKLISTFGSHQ